MLVNAIAPGPIKTPLLDGETEEWRSAKLAELPIGRFGEVAEVTPTAVLLASADGSYYVGQTLGPNGGDVDAVRHRIQCRRGDAHDEPCHPTVVEPQRGATDVRLIRFEYCDVSGVARTKAIHVDQLEHKLLEGVSLTRAQMAINLLEQVVPIEGMEPVGEIRLVPDPATFTVLPWSPGSASVLCDQLDHDRTDWGACPRSFLQRVIARAAALGVTVQATFENEYYLASRAGRSLRAVRRCRATPRCTARSGTTTTRRS